MISGLWNGLTGLNTFEKALSAQSNNVTNANTIAHKSDVISFEDMMYQSRYGKGVTVQSIEKNFEQGNIKLTNNPLDVAIEGDGFFIVKDTINDQTFYTRAGNFKIGNDGTLESIDGNKVLGSQNNISNVITSDGTTQFNSDYSNSIASEIINNSAFNQSINSKSTNYIASATDSGISGNGFKTASGKIADIEVLLTDYKEKLKLYSSNPLVPGTSSSSQITQIDFSDFTSKLQGSGSFIEAYVNGDLIKQDFETDQLTTINKFTDKISNLEGLSASIDSNGLLTITTLSPGKDINITSPAIDTNGYGVVEIVSPILGTGIAMVNSSRDALKTALENADAKFLEMTNTISNTSLANVGQLQLKLNNLNISENDFGTLSIEEGAIYAKDGENKFLIGRLETASFINPDSLLPQGNNLYSIGAETSEAKNASSINKLVGASVELSNTNLGDDLVDLMVFQRAYEASSKSITTSDEFLKTAIELKK